MHTTLASERRASNLRHRVLVVDDYPDSAEAVRMLVEVLGHETRVAHSGRAALAEAYDFEPSIVILDMGLPDLTGYEVARALRARRGGAAVHIIGLSGWGHDERRQAALAAGCDHYIVKPADCVKIRSLIGELHAR